MPIMTKLAFDFTDTRNGGDVKISINIGDNSKDYRIGDYLNAIDELTCYFQAKTNHFNPELAAALKLYADEYLNER